MVPPRVRIRKNIYRSSFPTIPYFCFFLFRAIFRDWKTAFLLAASTRSAADGREAQAVTPTAVTTAVTQTAVTPTAVTLTA
jgi:hypothetical protein